MRVTQCEKRDRFPALMTNDGTGGHTGVRCHCACHAVELAKAGAERRERANDSWKRSNPLHQGLRRGAGQAWAPCCARGSWQVDRFAATSWIRPLSSAPASAGLRRGKRDDKGCARGSWQVDRFAAHVIGPVVALCSRLRELRRGKRDDSASYPGKRDRDRPFRIRSTAPSRCTLWRRSRLSSCAGRPRMHNVGLRAGWPAVADATGARDESPSAYRTQSEGDESPWPALERPSNWPSREG